MSTVNSSLRRLVSIYLSSGPRSSRCSQRIAFIIPGQQGYFPWDSEPAGCKGWFILPIHTGNGLPRFGWGLLVACCPPVSVLDFRKVDLAYPVAAVTFALQSTYGRASYQYSVYGQQRSVFTSSADHPLLKLLEVLRFLYLLPGFLPCFFWSCQPCSMRCSGHVWRRAARA